MRGDMIVRQLGSDHRKTLNVSKKPVILREWHKAGAIVAWNDANIWIYDFARAGAPSRLTFGGKNRSPVWSSDGQWIAFQSDREGDLAIFRQRADGAGVAERVTKPEQNTEHVPESWSPKEDVLLFRAVEGRNVVLWSYSISDKKGAPFGGVRSLAATNAAFSPDGRWVAYHSREGTQTDEVYVQPFPATGSKYQLPITRDNHHPVWSRDGKELFYIPGPGEFAVISVATTPGFVFGSPAPVRQVLQNYPPSSPRHYDITADGRLAGLIPFEQSQSGAIARNQIHVVLNWFTELEQRVPVK
jgi:serine/threonine-protein kinase